MVGVKRGSWPTHGFTYIAWSVSDKLEYLGKSFAFCYMSGKVVWSRTDGFVSCVGNKTIPLSRQLRCRPFPQGEMEREDPD
jgi:hypothetical protein